MGHYHYNENNSCNESALKPKSVKAENFNYMRHTFLCQFLAELWEFVEKF